MCNALCFIVFSGANGDHHQERVATPAADLVAAQAPAGGGKAAAGGRDREGREGHPARSLEQAPRQREGKSVAVVR